jgi:hypothetical protein
MGTEGKKKRKKHTKEGGGSSEKKKRRRSSKQDGHAEQPAAADGFVPEDGTASAVGGCDWRADTTEMWLVRMPVGLDPEQLHGQEVELRGANFKPSSGSSKKLCATADNGRKYRLNDVGGGAHRQYIHSFVCDEEQAWVLGKPFARQVDLVESFDWGGVGGGGAGAGGAEQPPRPAINPPLPFHRLGSLVDRYKPLGGADGLAPRAAGQLSTPTEMEPKKKTKRKKDKKKDKKKGKKVKG